LDVLNRAVARLTLRAPTTRKEINAALRAVEELSDDAPWRETIRTTLAIPAAHLTHLACSLNNLSNPQSGTGDWQAALASITEAVEIRRTLAQANPAAHLPDLAMSLNNLSVQQSGTG
ncbi:hypothetical protein PUR53_00835, partial [Streptomyces sp. SP18BB07]|nr:hypothetical protein [Streptomyces sp. SP18BB07]